MALGLVADDKPGETSETALEAPPPATPPHDVKPHETSETVPPPLAGVSTDVLRRTLKRRLQRHRPGGAEQRPEPAVLAGVADAALVAECTRRLKPAHMARLMKQLAPLHAAE